MTGLADRERCSGCGACAAACPASCIEMTADELGFLYPAVNAQACAGCGRCSKGCPALHEARRLLPIAQYGVWHQNQAVVRSSSSGGFFTAMADAVLAGGGMVCGAVYSEGFHAVRSVLFGDAAAVRAMRGSKYVQSVKGGVFAEIRTALSRGRTVLFTGTPCEAAGLKSFLGREYGGLIVCDLICNGVGSPSLFSSYVGRMERRYKSEVASYTFRSKKKGWTACVEASFLNGGHYLRLMADDEFGRSYVSSMLLRSSCYGCVYASPARVGDLTMGDFWGYGRLHPDGETPGGVSVVLINSEKGNRLFELCKSSLVYRRCRLDDAVGGNVRLSRPLEADRRRERCLRDYRAMRYESFARRWLKDGWIKALLKKSGCYEELKKWMTTPSGWRRK